jgi:hypothetical protein
MGPQGKLTGRFGIPGSDMADMVMTGPKERLLSSGSVSGSPGRLHDNVSRDSGIGCLKVRSLTAVTDTLVHRYIIAARYTLAQ